MKNIILAGALLLAAIPGAAAAADVTWNCDFKGTYTEAGQAGKKDFKWKVKWIETESGTDKLTGTVDEEGYKSTSTGTCDAKTKTCKIDESITSGEEKGKKYYWSGTYSDAETKNPNVYITTMKGTWGESASDRKSGGTCCARRPGERLVRVPGARHDAPDDEPA